MLSSIVYALESNVEAEVKDRDESNQTESINAVCCFTENATDVGISSNGHSIEAENDSSEISLRGRKSCRLSVWSEQDFEDCLAAYEALVSDAQLAHVVL